MPLFVEAPGDNAGISESTFDFIGIGFGPSNLALAVAAREIEPEKKGIFFERQSAFQWHPGIMLEGSRMQISFLKDLVTLRNPASPFTFLQYTKAKGRLERFVNLSDFHPTRLEYQDYLKWVAEAFSESVRYGTVVRKVTPIRLTDEPRDSRFRLEVQNVDTGEVSVYFAKSVVTATGGKARVCEGDSAHASRMIHSGEFLQQFPRRFPETDIAYEFGVVGCGQSAGEIVADLLDRYPRCRVHMFVTGYTLRPVDSTPFVNEAFFSDQTDAFFQSSAPRRKAIQATLRNTNYGAIAPELIRDIYRRSYMDEIKGHRRLFVHNFSRVVSAVESGDGVAVKTQDGCDGDIHSLRCDGLILATGYQQCLDNTIFEDVLPFLARNDSGDLILSRNYAAQTTSSMDCRLYLQGHGESSHGLGDTLLSLLPFRSQEIFDDIRKHTQNGIDRQSAPAHAVSIRYRAGEYPPAWYLERDPGKLYAVMERFKFATLISAQPSGKPIATHVPLILDRSRGAKGVLFGHVDRANPHVDVLDGGEVLAIFHGPNSYISPDVYETDQLPTWNSIAVHVWGRTRVLWDRRAIFRGLSSICEQSDKPGGYRLNGEDARIERLMDFIVAFEFEIDDLVGRFKLSQDRAEPDRVRAAMELARGRDEGERSFIEGVLGCRLKLDSLA